MPSFDTSPVLYWIPVYLLCWGLLWLAIRDESSADSRDGKVRRAGRCFVPAALVLLFLLRLPSIVYNQEINPDESQIITQAMTLRQDPVYFRSVDGTTGGPLDSYFLILPSFLGFPFDYITAHLTAYGLVAVSLWLLFRTAQVWFGTRAARLALLPLVLLLGLTRNGDFIHYSSELVPVALLSWGYYLYARHLNNSVPSVRHIALIGLLMGMVPFGKLQGTPLAAVVGLFVALDVLFRQRLTASDKIRRLGALGAGGLAFPALAVLLAWLGGVYDDFVTFYIVGNVQYAGEYRLVENLLRLPYFFRKGTEFDWLVKLTIGVWLVALVVGLLRGFRRGRLPWMVVGFLATLLPVTLYAITRTGSEYVHYLFFLMGPLMLWLAYGWSVILASLQQTRGVVAIGGLVSAVFLGMFAVDAWQLYQQGMPLNPYPSNRQEGWRLQQTPVSTVITKYADPGEKLAVWGWRCDYYVQAQMPQGVAENHTIRSVFDNPLKEAYQRRYYRNMTQSLPPVFVDAVGSQNLWMTDRATQGHESYPPLGEFIKTHYRYVGLVNDTRIYVRVDRVARYDQTLKPMANLIE
ncbi:hypothetical protein GCM10023189_53260 [Nibrella saemangeumensis]|uniref:Glycosyltransferase RgtA/B/C/D-like domain-containing protein n=1 Tax=Nibrella saemangeumensis TaxID=1084526 RepID=A0ABP8NMB9_9BACT